MSENLVYLNNINLAIDYPDDCLSNLEEGESISSESVEGKPALIFLKHIKQTNVIPFNKGSYHWSDSIWDFSDYTSLSINPASMRFPFGRCCETFREELKTYILILLLENRNKIQTIHIKFAEMSLYFNYLESRGYTDIKYVDTGALRDYLKQRKESSSIRIYARTCSALRLFYLYYSVHFEDVLTKEAWTLFDDIDPKARDAEAKAHRLQDIPSEWFNSFMKAAITIAKDESEPIHIRGTACIYILLGQTGLRLGECLSLETGFLKTTTIFNGDTAYYLKYKTWKGTQGNNAYFTAETYINELSKFAYETLIALYSDERKKQDTPLLFLGSIKRRPKRFPLDSQCFSNYAEPFYMSVNKYMEIVNVDEKKYPTLFTKKIAKGSTKKNHPEAKTYTAPKNHQFRVHVCSELYRSGVPLEYINRFMAHLSEDMADYYPKGRKRDIQEDKEFSIKIIGQLVSGDLKLLGGKNPEGLQEQIQQFLKENNLNVATDMEAINEALSKKLPIRQKTGGVCIKSSTIRDCAIDAATNEFYCAYGVCPNLFHFFYMADVSYRQARELSESIGINKKNGFLKQAHKETNMLHTIVQKKLLPELVELKKQINEKGMLAVLQEYPDLKDIIENLEEIEREANEWKSMTV